MTEQSRIDLFVDWAKARLDEMAAALKALEAQVSSLDDRMREDAQASVSKFQGWLGDCEKQISLVQEQGEGAIMEARRTIEQAWEEFQPELAKWVETAKSHQATFEAQATAQLKSWQAMMDDFMAKASQMHEANKGEAEAAAARFKDEAKRAESQFEELRKAGMASWGAMSEALEQSRAAFEKAARQARDELTKAGRK